MQQPIRRQGFAAVDLEGPALKVRNFAAGLFDNQHARSRVPGIEVELPEPVEAAAGHAAQVERRRTRAPHAMGAQSDLVIEVNVRILVPLVAGKTSGHQALRQVRDLRHLDALLIQKRAASLLGREQLIARGIVDHASDALASCAPVPSETQKTGNPCAKLVVPSRGSTYQR